MDILSDEMATEKPKGYWDERNVTNRMYVIVYLIILFVGFISGLMIEASYQQTDTKMLPCSIFKNITYISNHGGCFLNRTAVENNQTQNNTNSILGCHKVQSGNANVIACTAIDNRTNATIPSNISDFFALSCPQLQDKINYMGAELNLSTPLIISSSWGELNAYLQLYQIKKC